MKHLTLFCLLTLKQLGLLLVFTPVVVALSSACSCQVASSSSSQRDLDDRYYARDRDANQCRAFCEANRMKVVIWTGRSTKTEFCGCAPEDAPCH